jgi:hypothetical protein
MALAEWIQAIPVYVQYRAEWIGGLPRVRFGNEDEIYSRGDEAALPGDDDNLETFLSPKEIEQISADDADRVSQTATDEFTIVQFKDHAGSWDYVNVKWNGQSDVAPTSSTVYLQIYNTNTTTWETLDSDSLTAADTDFDLEGTKDGLANYKDDNGYIICRVYQEAK